MDTIINLERKLSSEMINEAMKWRSGFFQIQKLLENKKYSESRFYDARTVYSIRKKLNKAFPQLFYKGFKNYCPKITDCTLEYLESGGKIRDTETNEVSYVQPKVRVRQDVFIGVNFQGTKEVTSCFCFSSMKDVYTSSNICVPCLTTNHYGISMRTIVDVENCLVSMPKKCWKFLDENKIPFVKLENIFEKIKDCSHVLYNYNFVWTNSVGYWDVFREPYTVEWKKKYERQDSL